MCSPSCPMTTRYRCEQGRTCGLHQINGGESVDTDEPPVTADDVICCFGFALFSILCAIFLVGLAAALWG